uniref:Leishmanolysin-like peptidase n=1 Tax=Trichobilharzia regenti TaxID=157069 RepID=A0AA85KLP2_TRIRE|nr:unnamed protein product [Trichobilharzia regenti]
MYTIFLSFSLISLYFFQGYESACGPPPHYEMKYAVRDESYPVDKRSNSAALKITVIYTKNFEQLKNSSAIKTKIVQRAINFWQKTLTVKNTTTGKIHFQRYCEGGRYNQLANGTIFCWQSPCSSSEKCGGINVPSQYLSDCLKMDNRNKLTTVYQKGSGLKAEGYLLFVDSQNTGSCINPSTNAYASSCQMDPETDRPVAGFVNFCPSKTVLEYPQSRSLYDTARHEIAHALGFARKNFAFMRAPDGSPRTQRDPLTKIPTIRDQYGVYQPSNTTVREITRRWVSAAGTYTKTFPALVTETIIREAKSHFQCQSVDGVDLENEGSSGSFGSHFEGRVYSNELMAAASEVEAFASKLTLAFFADSGWYTVNFNLADKWNYAKGYGCGFVSSSCYKFASDKKKRGESIKPYCDKPDIVTCKDLYSYGLCDVIQFPLTLPPADQFFGPEAGANYARLGGNDPFKDKCPTLGFLSSLGKLNVTSYCRHAENNAKIVKEYNTFCSHLEKHFVCSILELGNIKKDILYGH